MVHCLFYSNELGLLLSGNNLTYLNNTKGSVLPVFDKFIRKNNNKRAKRGGA